MPDLGYKQAILSHPRLGKATVSEIARDVGCSYKNVWMVLSECGQKVLNRNLKVEIMSDPDFGKLPAYKLADKLGLKRTTVGGVMRDAGLRTYKKGGAQ